MIMGFDTNGIKLVIISIIIIIDVINLIIIIIIIIIINDVIVSPSIIVLAFIVKFVYLFWAQNISGQTRLRFFTNRNALENEV